MRCGHKLSCGRKCQRSSSGRSKYCWQHKQKGGGKNKCKFVNKELVCIGDDGKYECSSQKKKSDYKIFKCLKDSLGEYPYTCPFVQVGTDAKYYCDLEQHGLKHPEPPNSEEVSTLWSDNLLPSSSAPLEHITRGRAQPPRVRSQSRRRVPGVAKNDEELKTLLNNAFGSPPATTTPAPEPAHKKVFKKLELEKPVYLTKDEVAELYLQVRMVTIERPAAYMYDMSGNKTLKYPAKDFTVSSKFTKSKFPEYDKYTFHLQGTNGGMVTLLPDKLTNESYSAQSRDDFLENILTDDIMPDPIFIESMLLKHLWTWAGFDPRRHMEKGNQRMRSWLNKGPFIKGIVRRSDLQPNVKNLINELFDRWEHVYRTGNFPDF